MSNADQIREFAFTRYVAPARRRGDKEITLRAGDIHSGMKLVSALPAVCSALDGRKFTQLAGVSLIERRGPPQGANVYLRFSLASSLALSEPLLLREPRTGSPEKPSPIPGYADAVRVVDLRGALVLVSCVKSKLPRPAPARDLNASSWFKKVRAIVEASGERWLILSALHGLVTPDAVIAPYEHTLNTAGVAERRAWANGVLNALIPHLNGVRRVVIFAGVRYREFLVEPLRQRGITVEVPMEGLQRGPQLSWLSGSK